MHEVSNIVSAAKWGAAFGTIIGGVIMARIGRKKAIAILTTFYVIGPFLMAVSDGVTLLWIGRFIVGLGVGASALVSPAYMGEMAPPHLRGAFVATYEFMLGLGNIMGVVIDFALSDVPNNWRWMVGMPIVFALPQYLVLCLLPESPRWLIWKGQIDKGLEVINKIYSKPDSKKNSEIENGESEKLGRPRSESFPPQNDAEKTMLQYWSDSEKEKKMNKLRLVEYGNRCCNGCSCLRRCDGLRNVFRYIASWTLELYKGPENNAFRLVMIMAFINQACASTSIMNYGANIICELANAGTNISCTPSVGNGTSLTDLKDSFKTATLMITAVSVAKCVGILIAIFLFDNEKCGGRRRLMLIGSYAMAAFMILLTIAGASQSLGLTVFAMVGFVFAFSTSWAGGFWVIISEVFSMRIKALASPIATCFLFLIGAVTDEVFLLLNDSPMGFYSFLLFATVALAGGLYLQASLPETMGKTLSEVQDLLGGGKSKNDCCPCLGSNFSKFRTLPDNESPQKSASDKYRTDGAAQEFASSDSDARSDDGMFDVVAGTEIVEGTEVSEARYDAELAQETLTYESEEDSGEDFRL